MSAKRQQLAETVQQDPHRDAALESGSEAVPPLAGVDWGALERELDARGHAVIPALLDARQCEALVALYADERRFRSRVVMARHGFGQGEYKYFDYPLPGLVQELRSSIYPALVPIAERWSAALRQNLHYPAGLAEFLQRCHAAGQAKPTPLLLSYQPGDYNCLHQDLYGEHVFPLQVAVLLSEPTRDFDGGEFVMTEQRPRMQSRAMVVPLRQGDAVVFAVHQRPVQGARGAYRVSLRHGVSAVRAGRRYTLGVIFHDAA